MDIEKNITDLGEYRERHEEPPRDPALKAAIEDLFYVHPWDAYAAQKRFTATLEQEVKKNTPEPIE